MARLIRLLSPGIAFFGLGVIVLVAGKWPWFHLRGGLVTVGLYSLALQIVLSAVLISAIPDRAGRGVTFGHLGGRAAGGIIDISDQPISFSRALVEFYRRPFLPLLLLGFGLGASLSALLVGSFHEDSPVRDLMFGSLGMRRSEAVLGVILVVGAAFLWWRGGRGGYFGWTIGMSIAIVFGQVVFVLGTNARETIASWGGLMIGLCLLRLLALGIARAQRAGPSVAPDRDSIRTGETLHTKR
jgi:hypothetical protein